jgi:adenine deaminase
MSTSLNNHRRTNLYDVTKSLVATALGREKVDLVIKNGNLVNVNSGELLEALGEVINYPCVLAGDNTMHGEIAAALRAKKVVGGHDASLLGTDQS